MHPYTSFEDGKIDDLILPDGSIIDYDTKDDWRRRRKRSWQACRVKERNEGASKDPGCTKKTQGNRVGITFPLIDSDGGVTRSRYMSIKQELCKIIWTNAE